MKDLQLNNAIKALKLGLINWEQFFEIMKIVCLIGTIVCLSHTSKADDWFCKEGSSKRSGFVISACGIGQGTDEGKARNDAFDAARVEFNKICKMSADCQNKQIIVNPMRTSCDVVNKSYKCYRMIEFKITDEEKKSEVKNEEKSDEIKPFYYSEIADKPKAKEGMTKAEILEILGKPDSVSYDTFFYSGYACQYKSTCFVRFEKNKAASLYQVNMDLTEVLK